MPLKPTLATRGLCLLMAFALSSCGDAQKASEEKVDEGAASSVASAAGSGGKLGDIQTQDNYIAFSIDGREKNFTRMPADKNMAMSSATMLLARPAANVEEQFSILVMNFNVKSAELPQTLSLNLRKAMENEGNAAAFVSAPKPLISYVSPDGIEYASYADVTFESYRDGILTGSIGAIELSPKNGASSAAAPISLSDMRFRVAL